MIYSRYTDTSRGKAEGPRGLPSRVVPASMLVQQGAQWAAEVGAAQPASAAKIAGEMYDMENDSNEFDNLWDHPKYQELRNQLIKASFDASVLAIDLGSPLLTSDNACQPWLTGNPG